MQSPHRKFRMRLHHTLLRLLLQRLGVSRRDWCWQCPTLPTDLKRIPHYCDGRVSLEPKSQKAFCDEIRSQFSRFRWPQSHPPSFSENILDAESSRRVSMALSLNCGAHSCKYACMPNVRLEYLGFKCEQLSITNAQGRAMHRQFLTRGRLCCE